MRVNMNPKTKMKTVKLTYISISNRKTEHGGLVYVGTIKINPVDIVCTHIGEGTSTKKGVYSDAVVGLTRGVLSLKKF